MANIVEKLVLKTDEHDAKLKQARAALRNYAKEQEALNKAASAMTSAMKNFVGVVGLSMTAMEAFNKTIGSTQTLTDEFGRVTESVTSVVDNFFYSLASGDFSQFTEGLDRMISRAREAYDAMDALGTFLIEQNFETSNIEMQRQQARLQIRKNPQDAEAKAKLQELDKQMEDVLKKQSDAYMTALKAQIREKFGTGKGYEDEILKYFKIGGQDQAKVDAAKMKEGKLWSDPAKQLEKFSQLADEEYQKMADLYSKAMSSLSQSYSVQASDQRLLNSGSTKTSAPKATKQKEEKKAESKKIDIWSLEREAYEDNLDSMVNSPLIEAFIQSQKKMADASFYKELNGDNQAWLQYIEGLDIAKKKMDELRQKNEAVANTLSQVGNAFTSMGQAFEEPVLNIAGTIMQAIATMIMSYAQALAMAAKLGPIGWIAFGATGLATLAGLVASIKNMGSFAGGGIIKGAFSSGDMNIAHVNSGEMILNTTQQGNLFKMLNEGWSAEPATQSTIKLKMEGRDMVAVLDKNLRQISRNA